MQFSAMRLLTYCIIPAGIFQQGLFRVIPNKDRHRHLLILFDHPLDLSEPSKQPSLRKERVPDIAALLSSYIAELPEPLMPKDLFSAFWAWCVRPSIMREHEHNKEILSDNEDCTNLPLPPLLTPKSLWRKRPKSSSKGGTADPEEAKTEKAKTQEELEKETARLEEVQIQVAQHIFQLLEPESLSLLGYLCAFFSQIPLSPENGIVFEDIGRLFGPKLLGGISKICAKNTMEWILNRWDRIASGIFGEEGSSKETLNAGRKQSGSGFMRGDDAAPRRGSAPLPSFSPEVAQDRRERSQSMTMPQGKDGHTCRDSLNNKRLSWHTRSGSDGGSNNVRSDAPPAPPVSSGSPRTSTSRGSLQRSDATRRQHASSTSSSSGASSTDVASTSNSSAQIKTPEEADDVHPFDDEIWKRKASPQLSVVREVDDGVEQCGGISVTAHMLDSSIGASDAVSCHGMPMIEPSLIGCKGLSPSWERTRHRARRIDVLSSTHSDESGYSGDHGTVKIFSQSKFGFLISIIRL